MHRVNTVVSLCSVITQSVCLVSVAYSGRGRSGGEQWCDHPTFGLTVNFWIIFALFL